LDKSVKIVNFIEARTLKHNFKQLCQATDSKQHHPMLLCLIGFSSLAKFAYLSDMFYHLNTLNITQQRDLLSYRSNGSNDQKVGFMIYEATFYQTETVTSNLKY
jgi:hypothetical protein